MIVKFLSIVFLICFFFLNTNAQDTIVIDQIVAVVGRQTILKSEIENQLIQMKAQGYYSAGDVKCEILEEMLYGKLLVNQAILDSVEVSDDEINSEMERRLNYFINQIGSEEQLEVYYKKTIPEIKEDFREVIKDQLLSQRMQQKVTADLKVTPQEVKSFFKEIPKDSMPIINTEFQLEQIIVNPAIKEAEILRIKDQLRDFKERITKGENFASLAILYSEDPGTSTKGGELGFFGRGDMVAEFSAVAFNLEIGEVSKVVKTDYGFHIIQLIDKKGERINCRHILLKPRISPDEKLKARQKLDTVRAAIVREDITFKQACWKYSEDEDTRASGGVMVNPATGNSHWEAAQLPPKIAFAISTMQVGDVSEPFEAEDSNGKTVYKIVLLREKSDPHPANLEENYQNIQDMALEKKKGEFMEGWISKKIKSTYIRIDDSYKKCDFKNKEWNIVK